MHQNPNCPRKRAINVDFGRTDQGNISQTSLARRSGRKHASEIRRSSEEHADEVCFGQGIALEHGKQEFDDSGRHFVALVVRKTRRPADPSDSHARLLNQVNLVDRLEPD
jgi:hypothetical protein